MHRNTSSGNYGRIVRDLLISFDFSYKRLVSLTESPYCLFDSAGHNSKGYCENCLAGDNLFTHIFIGIIKNYAPI